MEPNEAYQMILSTMTWRLDVGNPSEMSDTLTRENFPVSLRVVLSGRSASDQAAIEISLPKTFSL